MVSIFTPNVQLEEPARGDYVGIWDTPVNANMTLIDLVVGGRTAIPLNNSNVVLSAAQFQCKTITFSSTLTGSVIITFPTSFTKSYEIYNTCTGSSAFTITMTTTASTRVICAPPGEIVTIINDGSNLGYINLDRVGAYWDFGGSSVPNWVNGCTIPPYLVCEGGSFSSAAFPTLTMYLGGTTLPDAKGRYRATLDQASGRITSSQGGVNGTAILAGGGQQTVLLSSTNLPASALGDTGHFHNLNQINSNLLAGGGVTALTPTGNPTSLKTDAAFTGITFGSSSPSTFSNLPPTYIGGITMIRTG